MASNYELRKHNVDPKAAASIFSQDFATRAFEQGLHRTSDLRETGGERPRLPPDLISWIAHEGRQGLANACLAYLFSLGLKKDAAEDRSFVDLITQIRDGAKKIAIAADTLAGQLQHHLHVANRVEPVRYRALVELAAALNAETLSEEDLLPSRAGGPFAGATIRHGLQNCWRLHNHAEYFLSRYHSYAKVMRAEGKKALEMSSGRPTSADRDDFIADLAALYKEGTNKKPSARVGSATTGYAPSPFTRFVAYVFEELRITCSVLDVSQEIHVPSADTLRGALRRAAMAA